MSPASDHIGFTIKGPLPYAAWTSWMVYTGKAQPFSLVGKTDLTPDPGNVNPWSGAPTPISAPKRSFTLLVLPDGVDRSATAPSMQTIPASNVLRSPNNTKAAPMWILANRVYMAFPGYNRGGAGRAGRLAVPDHPCRGLHDREGRALRAAERAPGQGAVAVDRSTHHQPARPAQQPGAQERPAVRPSAGRELPRQGLPVRAPNPTGLIQFTRPPLLPGADVSAIPPADNCAGYLGTRMPTDQISLIRVPHVATYFDTRRVTPTTPCVQKEAD